MTSPFLTTDAKEEGQALFEFIFFLPLMLILYNVVLSYGNAINGSINQQKAVRGYFFALIKNNSTLPIPDWDDKFHLEWSSFGHFFIGWRERFDGGDTPVSPCYAITIPLLDTNEGACESYTSKETKYVRVESIFGICGATYQSDTGFVRRATPGDSVGGAGCHIID